MVLLDLRLWPRAWGVGCAALAVVMLRDGAPGAAAMAASGELLGMFAWWRS